MSEKKKIKIPKRDYYSIADAAELVGIRDSDVIYHLRGRHIKGAIYLRTCEVVLYAKIPGAFLFNRLLKRFNGHFNDEAHNFWISGYQVRHAGLVYLGSTSVESLLTMPDKKKLITKFKVCSINNPRQSKVLDENSPYLSFELTPTDEAVVSYGEKESAYIFSCLNNDNLVYLAIANLISDKLEAKKVHDRFKFLYHTMYLQGDHDEWGLDDVNKFSNIVEQFYDKISYNNLPTDSDEYFMGLPLSLFKIVHFAVHTHLLSTRFEKDKSVWELSENNLMLRAVPDKTADEGFAYDKSLYFQAQDIVITHEELEKLQRLHSDQTKTNSARIEENSSLLIGALAIFLINKSSSRYGNFDKPIIKTLADDIIKHLDCHGFEIQGCGLGNRSVRDKIKKGIDMLMERKGL